MDKEAKERLIKLIYNGVRAIAYRHARGQDEAKDFLQEGLIHALEAIERYKDKPEAELVLIIAKCAFNRIMTMQSGCVTHSFRNTDLETFANVLFMPRMDEEPEAQSFLRVLRSRLPKLACDVLQERFDPSWKTLNEEMMEREEKTRRRSRGELVMNVHEEKINDTHIARALGISKATVSRSVKLIQQEAQELLAG